MYHKAEDGRDKGVCKDEIITRSFETVFLDSYDLNEQSRYVFLLDVDISDMSLNERCTRQHQAPGNVLPQCRWKEIKRRSVDNRISFPKMKRGQGLTRRAARNTYYFLNKSISHFTTKYFQMLSNVCVCVRRGECVSFVCFYKHYS